MTKDTQAPGSGAHDADRHSGENAGPIRSRGPIRARSWVLALALIGLGAIGGGLATVSMDAGAHGGWRDGGWRHGHRHGHMDDPEKAIERLQHGSAHVLGRVDATDEQRERVDAILAETVNDIFPLRKEFREHRRDLIAELARPEVDRAALEQIRAAKLAIADTVSARMLDSVVAIAEVLDPEQRQQLVERLSRRWH